MTEDIMEDIYNQTCLHADQYIVTHYHVALGFTSGYIPHSHPMSRKSSSR